MNKNTDLCLMLQMDSVNEPNRYLDALLEILEEEGHGEEVHEREDHVNFGDGKKYYYFS